MSYMKTLSALAIALGCAFIAAPALAANCSSLPYTLTNGTTADANKVMANFNGLLNCSNNNLAHKGANSDITSLLGLTTPLSAAQGGTGNTTGGPSGTAGGVLSGSYPSPAFANNVVANATLTTVAAGTIKGRALTTGTGNVQDLTSAQVTAILTPVAGDTGAGGVQGAVPAPPTGSAAAGYALLASGVFGSLDLTKQTASISTSGGSYYFQIGTIYVEFGVAAAVAPDSTASVTFPKTFPTACLFMMAGIHKSAFDNTKDNVAETIGSCGTISATVANNQINNNATADVPWIAIGN